MESFKSQAASAPDAKGKTTARPGPRESSGRKGRPAAVFARPSAPDQTAPRPAGSAKSPVATSAPAIPVSSVPPEGSPAPRPVESEPKQPSLLVPPPTPGSGAKPMTIRIQDILDRVQATRPDADLAMLQRAYIFSASHHAGQVRLSGEPYLSHPLEVAYLLADLRMDDATIVAGLLHDTLEDTKATREELTAMFGQAVTTIVEGVSKISQIHFESKEEAQAENIRKMIMAMAEDIRVLVVKLADRVHNMRTLQFQKPHKQMLIAQETMDIYVPLANRLGLHRIKLELEDLSFMYLKPDIYSQLTDWLERNHSSDQAYIEKVAAELQKMLADNKIKGEIKGRLKHKYSIYRKLIAQGLSVDQVHDVIAFRILVDKVKHCYAVLGLVHAEWKPVQGRFKDYISMPKANMYQSLHTTVFGPEGERFEIQIRTHEMDHLAEHGVASHWLYKEGRKVKEKDAAQFAWLHELLNWQEQERDSVEFMRALRLDVFKEDIYVFTPNGEIKELPEGATPVDFAYSIHSKVGHHCAGAKVNGKLVPLGTHLVSGDSVEIITNTHQHPSRDWLRFVKTTKARTNIKNYLNIEEREQSIALGKEMLEKQGRRMGVNLNKIKDQELAELATELSYKSVEELFSSVGYARITPRKVLNKFLPKAEESAAATPPPQPAEVAAQIAAKPAQRSEGIVVSGIDDVLVRFAGCCNPLPGDAIVGYISRGRGITVHTTSCMNLNGMEPERLVPVFWEGHEGRPYPVRIRILCRNEMGILAKVAGVLAERRINIDSGQFRSLVDGNTEIDFTVEVEDVDHLYHTLDQLRRLDNIIEVLRDSETTVRT